MPGLFVFMKTSYWCRNAWMGWLLALLGWSSARSEDIRLDLDHPTMDRWMYPFNFEPETRPVAPTFASFDPRFDTRDAQFLLGWDTDGVVPVDRPASRYLLKRVRLTLTVSGDLTFLYDSTFDSYLTHATNSPGYVLDSDRGRPIELFGAGFRGGFTAATFVEKSPYGPLNAFDSANISIGTRNAYAAAFDDDGLLVDIANHVGQHNASWTNAPFEAHPWAIGVCTGVADGDLVPRDTKFTFDVRLSDPKIHAYFQEALRAGKLRLFVSSLSPAAQVTPGGVGPGGSGSYPQWATRKNILYDAPRLELEGVVVSDVDADGDGIPDDWERFYFGSTSVGPLEDPDEDGVGNLAEFERGTDPTRADPKPVAVEGLTLVKVEADGTVQLRFKSEVGRKHRVEVSGDLVNWRVATGEFVAEADGWVRFRESDLTLPPLGRSVAFYRVAVQ